MFSVLLKKLGFHIEVHEAAMTSGLVGDFKPYAVLPQITPSTTMLLVLCTMLPCLVRIWRKPHQKDVVRCIAYAYICGFMFGWHVHEKASLHFMIPLSLVAIGSLPDARDYVFLSIVSYYSLFPLLFGAKEYSIKVNLLLLHTLIMYLGFSVCLRGSCSATCKSGSEMNCPRPHKGVVTGQIGFVQTQENTEEKMTFLLHQKGEIVYIVGLAIVEIYGQFLHTFIFEEKLPFLPLMLISVYCALGMMYAWIKQLIYMMTN